MVGATLQLGNNYVTFDGEGVAESLSVAQRDAYLDVTGKILAYLFNERAKLVAAKETP
jgi:hypothetical protein